MISDCKECCEGKHEECQIENCLCQHTETERLPDGTVTPVGVKRALPK
jgi:hypothetical protein